MAMMSLFGKHFLIFGLSIVFLSPINSVAQAPTPLNKQPKINKQQKAINQPIANKQKETKKQEPANSKQDQNVVQPETQKSLLVWHGTDIEGLITGSVAAGYSKPDAQSGSFDVIDFNPVFLFSYKDLLFLNSSLDFERDDLGNTSASLDTLNLNLIFNDYASFGVGLFDTSTGKFVPHLSPDWINKLPSVPVGFDDGEAAPQSEIGAQFRGGFYLPRCVKVNYILFLANGPIATADEFGNVQQIFTDGYSNTDRDNFVGGGRIGVLPIPKLEIGISAAIGDVSVFDDFGDLLDKRQNYDVFGADISYKWNNWDLHYEYIQQEANVSPDLLVSNGGIWRAWYAQVAYRFNSSNFEPIVRYGKFRTPFDDQNQQQLAFGLDYWLAPSLVAKIDYEFNEGLDNTANDVNVLNLELAFGF